MKAMPALSAPDVAPRTGQGARKVADGDRAGRGTDFTRELRKREEPDRQAQVPDRPAEGGKATRPAGPDTGTEEPAPLPDPELSARLAGAEGLPGFGTARRGRRTDRQGDAPSDVLPRMEMPEGAAAVADLSRLPSQAVPAAMARGGKTEGNVGPAAEPVLSVDALLPEAADPTDAATGEMPDSALPGGLRPEAADAPGGRGRIRHAREMRVEPAGGEERMSVKVVSVSTERHLEPVGTTAPGGREGMWRGAAAQVLAALDEGLVPRALAGLDGARTGGPKVIRNLEIQLHPASLGTVTARLTISGGNMEITISVPDRRLADQMERGLDQLVRRIRARDHGSGQTVVHLVTEPQQNQTVDRFQQQLPGQPATDGRSAFGGQAREGAPGGGHGGRDGHGGAHAHDGGGAGHEGMRETDGTGRAARRGGLLYL